MSDIFIAWDIETCPFPLDNLSAAQQSRYDSELAHRQQSHSNESEADSSRLVRSVHPFLGWICCISAVSGTASVGPNTPCSWTASEPNEESTLLSEFWEAISGFPNTVTWATFNGKRFDVPFIEARCLHHGITPTRTDLLNTVPYRHRPHADLCRVWPQYYGLSDICDLLGVDDPKSSLDGSQVASAVKNGRIDDVADYAESDVVATFRCLQAAWSLLSA